MLESRISIALAFSYCCLGIRAAFLSSSSLDYYSLGRVIVPSVVVLNPTTVAEKFDLTITALLPNTKEGAAAKTLLLSKTNEMQRLHKSWLLHTRLHESFALYQTIGWAVAFVLSLCAIAPFSFCTG